MKGKIALVSLAALALVASPIKSLASGLFLSAGVGYRHSVDQTISENYAPSPCFEFGVGFQYDPRFSVLFRFSQATANGTHSSSEDCDWASCEGATESDHLKTTKLGIALRLTDKPKNNTSLFGEFEVSHNNVAEQYAFSERSRGVFSRGSSDYTSSVSQTGIGYGLSLGITKELTDKLRAIVRAQYDHIILHGEENRINAGGVSLSAGIEL